MDDIASVTFFLFDCLISFNFIDTIFFLVSPSILSTNGRFPVNIVNIISMSSLAIAIIVLLFPNLLMRLRYFGFIVFEYFIIVCAAFRRMNLRLEAPPFNMCLNIFLDPDWSSLGTKPKMMLTFPLN